MDGMTLYIALAAVFGLYMAWGIGANDVANAMATSTGARAITQLVAMEATLFQCTASRPMPMAPKPTIAPISVCVVDTGQTLYEATVSQIAAASSEDSMP